MTESELLFLNKVYYDPSEYAEFKENFAKINPADLRTIGQENLGEGFYVQMIEEFLRTGDYSTESASDPICDYLISVMKDPEIRVKVLTDKVQARIFQDNMMQFVDTALHRKRFNFNRKQSEYNGVAQSLSWSIKKKQDGNQALLDMIQQSYEKYGFRTEFFRKQFQKQENLENPAMWESMFKEFNEAFNDFLRDETKKTVEQNADTAKKHLEQILETIPQYMKEKKITENEFEQAWGMMGGQWNELEFNRYVNIARLQTKYPELKKLADAMGRTITPDGDKSMWVGSGRLNNLEHSTKSDIQGVTFGRNLDSLLPIELVQLSDDDFDEVFLSKYTTNKLQSFLHRSQQLAPNKRLEKKRAKQKGPMIACIDTSGSMEGIPLQMAHSLVLKLVDISKAQNRDLFIIAFSVSARPIDTKKNQARLMEFFRNGATGDTNAEKMMKMTIELLGGKPEYMSADVVIIGDFIMPLVTKPLLESIKTFRENGTCFYGLQIGMYPDNKWLSYLDKVYRVGYTPPRRY